MKKLNNNIPLSDNEILNKYILTYTEPTQYIKELDKYFIDAIDETNDEKLIQYILEEYYNYNEIINNKNNIIIKNFMQNTVNIITYYIKTKAQ